MKINYKQENIENGEIKNRESFLNLLKKYNKTKKYNDLDKEGIKLEKNDFLALLLSAFIVIVIPVLLFMAIFVFLIFLIFGGFR